MPTSPDWIHEIKYDGFRLIVHRDGDRVRLLTRNGHNWADVTPGSSNLLSRIGTGILSSMVRTMVLGVDGIADFNALYSRRHDGEEQLYAFDILALDRDDLRKLPFSVRKANLARLLAGRPDGIFAAPRDRPRFVLGRLSDGP